jgi:hypothetical protein
MCPASNCETASSGIRHRGPLHLELGTVLTRAIPPAAVAGRSLRRTDPSPGISSFTWVTIRGSRPCVPMSISRGDKAEPCVERPSGSSDRLDGVPEVLLSGMTTMVCPSALRPTFYRRMSSEASRSKSAWAASVRRKTPAGRRGQVLPQTRRHGAMPPRPSPEWFRFRGPAARDSRGPGRAQE